MSLCLPRMPDSQSVAYSVKWYSLYATVSFNTTKRKMPYMTLIETRHQFSSTSKFSCFSYLFQIFVQRIPFKKNFSQIIQRKSDKSTPDLLENWLKMGQQAGSNHTKWWIIQIHTLCHLIISGTSFKKKSWATKVNNLSRRSDTFKYLIFLEHLQCLLTKLSSWFAVYQRPVSIQVGVYL